MRGGTGPPPPGCRPPCTAWDRDRAAPYLDRPPDRPRHDRPQPPPQPRSSPNRTSGTSSTSRPTRPAWTTTGPPTTSTSGSATPPAQATAAGQLGNAYLLVPGLRDLDQAQHWHQRSLDLRHPSRTGSAGPPPSATSARRPRAVPRRPRLPAGYRPGLHSGPTLDTAHARSPAGRPWSCFPGPPRLPRHPPQPARQHLRRGGGPAAGDAPLPAVHPAR